MLKLSSTVLKDQYGYNWMISKVALITVLFAKDNISLFLTRLFIRAEFVYNRICRSKGQI